MRWNATFIATLFFNLHELTKIVLQKLYQTFWSQIERTEPKRFFLFFCVTSRLSVFSALWDFLSKKNFPKGSPTECKLKTTKGSHFSFFGHSFVIFFHQFFYPSIFWCFATMDVKKCERIPLLVRQGPALAGTWRASSVVWVFHEFNTFMSFWYFSALDMAPTCAFPGLFNKSRVFHVTCNTEASFPSETAAFQSHGSSFRPFWWKFYSLTIETNSFSKCLAMVIQMVTFEVDQKPRF